MIFYDKEGNEVTAFDQDEVTARLDAAIEENVAELNKKIEELTGTLAEKETKITEIENSLKNKDDQTKRLAETKQTDSEKIKQLEESINEIKRGVTESVEKIKSRLLEKASEGDEDMRKKLELEFDGFSGDINDEESVKERIQKAYTIVNGEKPQPDIFDRVSTYGTDIINKGKSGPEESEEMKEQRKILGISDEDVKKYGSKDIISENKK